MTWICFWPLSWLVSWTTVGDGHAGRLGRRGGLGHGERLGRHQPRRPPLKSMPSLRPRVDSEMIPMRMMTAETPNHHLRLPMKSKEVWPR